MLVISTRELTQNQSKFFEIANKQRVIIKRKNRFFQIVDLGEMIPELNDSLISKEKMYAKIDKGIEEYKQGKTKKLDTKNINSFLGI
ncbi:MAG: hypothetical protein LBI82_13575 [Dysgonamonadaceae bacterium]|jgi:hypothetical protein|nr:hypothetical protein [Dysgonamonadaceae bacterium]